MPNTTPTPTTADTSPDFSDPRVKLVYDLLCEHDVTGKPEGDHWEGWIARRIVAALASAAQPAPIREDIIAELRARVQELERELVVEAGRAAQLRLTVSNLDHQHAMQAAMNSEARNELAAIRARGAQGESNADQT